MTRVEKMGFAGLCTIIFLTTGLQPAVASDHFNRNETYYQIRLDHRKCMSPLCGGYWVKRVNRASTRCVDGRKQSECYVAAIDWEALGLSDEQIAELSGWPEGVLLRGEIIQVELIGRTFGQFQPTEVWQAPTHAPMKRPGNPTALRQRDRGEFVRLHDSGIVCITWPCASFQEESLNWPRVQLIHEVNLAGVGATEDQLSAAYEALSTSSDGLLAVGTHHRIRGPAGNGKAFEATQFYLRVEPKLPSPCKPTGCSGQVCSDDNTITTCE